jgi:tRNA A37 N6-isopentenylltransferase MiaA
MHETARHLALVGPTASGKSALALEVARALGDVELVSVDSMQVYRGMDIGTAKPTPAERAEIPHHLLDRADPTEDFSVARFQAEAEDAIAAIEARGHRALLVGGTGLYLQAVVDGLRLPGQWPAVRAELEAELAAAAGDGIEQEPPAVATVHRRPADADAVTAAGAIPRRRADADADPVTAGGAMPGRLADADADAEPLTAAGAIPRRRADADAVTAAGARPRRLAEAGADPVAAVRALPLRLADAHPDAMTAVGAMYRRLAEADPLAAARIEPGNARRIVRALEVTLGSGRPFSSFGPGLDAYPRSTRFRLAGVWLPREVLNRRIEERYAVQLDAGFLDEVRALPEGLSRTARQALGYRELLAHLDGRSTLTEAVDEAVRRTRAFARRQRSWFRRDPRITWLGTSAKPLDLLPALLGDWARS